MDIQFDLDQLEQSQILAQGEAATKDDIFLPRIFLLAKHQSRVEEEQ
jgi:hypothetical protein